MRDILLGRPVVNELDFATSAAPETTRQLGEAAGASSVFDIGERFGTIGLVFQHESSPDPVIAEITTYRSEHYPDASRHPAVQLGGSLTDDLSRRDFTINAIAVDARSGELIDPFDGQTDLYLNKIRAVGDPDLRFQDDPLRLLRAARFVAQLGFNVDPATREAMTRQARYAFPDQQRADTDRADQAVDRRLCLARARRAAGDRVVGRGNARAQPVRRRSAG